VLKRHFPTIHLGIAVACVAGGILKEGVLLPAAILTLAALAARRVLDHHWMRTPLDLAVAGLAIMIPVSLWASALPQVTLIQVCRLITGIGLFYAITGWATTTHKLKSFPWIFTITGLGLAIYGLLNVDWILEKLAFLPVSVYTHLPRWGADTIHPNVLAGSLLLLFPVCAAILVFAWKESHSALRWMLLVATGVMLAVLGLSQSRGAMLGLGAALAVLTLLRWRQSWMWLLPILAFVLVALSVYSPSLILDSTTASTEPARKLEGRMEIWSRGLYMVQDYPFTGVGMGLYGQIADRIYPFFINAPGSVPHAHNLPLQIAVDLGIPGLIFWLGAFGAITAAMWNSFQQTRDFEPGRRWLPGLAAGFLGSQAALVFHGLLDATTWGMVRPAPLVWGLWGAACAAFLVLFSDTKHPAETGDTGAPEERIPSFTMLGVPVGRLTQQELIDRLLRAVDQKEHIIAAYVNIHAVNLAQEQPWFMEFLQTADLTYCDGYGITLGARLLGEHIPERFTPPDWLPALAEAWSRKSYSMAFLGSREGVAEKAAEVLSRHAPGLRVVYTQHGYFDKTPDSEENESIIAAINSSGADLLVIGVGMPAQECWLNENWARLTCNAALPIGAGFDYLAGYLPRAPRWMTDHGLEWLGRLLVEPERLWKRYLLGIPKFYIRLLK
jgi:exopolysaccharide biosynthesis WecB/TagA/CpsF family protein